VSGRIEKREIHGYRYIGRLFHMLSGFVKVGMGSIGWGAYIP
jgi:hypothetical protein